MDRLSLRPAAVFVLILAGLMVLTGCMLVPAEARAQRALDLENDTLTQSAPVHPPIDVSGRRMDLSTREHTYRPPLRLVDQLARDFTVMKVRTVMKVGDDDIGRACKPGTAGKENED
ncbi:hypothetical protein [Salinibacter ruber]|jgi:hypothetical protein|uniref:hypothetical protein n=1 Tax=Salinibacter ruber TaxID=146919 RepID=UPI001610FA69|nr:hypothetical protein [Salinibacter ruber]MBB4091406.1 hypothetical protein [Salinibacter ruber]MCS4103262.1 hypothetical protein [Salinibacter ruber]